MSQRGPDGIWRPWPADHKIAWWGFTVGAAVSISANVADSHPNVGARLAGGFWPIALLLAIEVISREQFGHTITARLARFGGTGVVAAVAAAISYTHLSSLLGRYGEGQVTAHIGPLAIDGLMVVCGTALLNRENTPRADAANATNQAARQPTAATEPKPARPAPATRKRKQTAATRRRGRKTTSIVIPDYLQHAAEQILADYQATGRKLTRDLLDEEIRHKERNGRPMTLGSNYRTALWAHIRARQEEAA
jgi:hypothetical protein